MKTILYNTQTEQIEGRIRKGLFNDIYNSGLSVEPGWLPDHVIELVVTEDPIPEYDPITQTLSGERVVDLENKLYKTVYTVTDKTQEQIQHEAWTHDWPHPEYAKRIVAPKTLAMEDVGAKMYVWFMLEKLPVVPVGDHVHLYCRYIREEHEMIIDSLQGVITIEDSPWVNEQDNQQEENE